ncbi:MAG: hypothetical protein JSV27_04165 [Candidatus Bathyarchaeota archaeon]|nr:MAG: hypothetical protein JSV27_04165 [Candidatus Bathyarchaeota archaeon]
MSDFRFGVSFGEELCSGPIDGRLLLLISDDDSEEPRFQISNFPGSQLIYGVDVDGLEPGEEAHIDGSVLGYPLESINDIPAGEYWVQALFHRYETIRRPDGHTLKLPMDRGEGQRWNMAPGNLFSTPAKIRIDPGKGETISIELDQEIPPVEEPEDTKYIRHVKLKSELLTEFWGRPTYLGAVVLLPEGYDKHPEARYPLIVWHGHFNQNLYAGFSEEPPDPELEPEPLPPGRTAKHTKDKTGSDVPRDSRYYEAYNLLVQECAHRLYEEWTSPGFPRMVLVNIQHPTPFFDDSYAVNSANQGPYGDAINHELIPHLEERFRCIGEGWARTLMGGSTGGWEVLVTQVFYPEMYNGCWCWCPDPIDFRATCLVDIYEDGNMYYVEGRWKRTLRPSYRSTVGEVLYTLKDEAQLEHIKGNRCRGGGQWDAWTATYSPVDDDGYPKPLFDRITGDIDPSVAEYWKENYDLRHIMARDWATLGPKLEGKIRIYCGDMDSHYLTNAVYLMEEFLENTEDPHYGGVVEYGRRYSHCFYGDHTKPSAMDRFVLVQRHSREMAEHITRTAPEGADTSSWRY